MVASLVVGALIGGLGGGLAEIVPEWVLSIYDPFIFMALTVVVGWNAASFGWSLVNGALAAFGSLVGQIMASVAVHGLSPFDGLAGGASGLNVLLLALTVLGPLAYLANRTDGWGVVACGMTAGVVLGEAVEELVHLLHGQPYQGWQWAVGTGFALAAVILLVFARRAAARLYALLVAMAYSSSYGMLALAL
ncbi:hypothetical protein [Acrocarpospora catenulata]|uniref:hypothetical protein n=1 Tax=Acrocarpospora catenulata TaxID=2836182 RepID=UPI001BD966E4|nr:hypothetical protein [Acrocarpospora catenulata]